MDLTTAHGIVLLDKLRNEDKKTPSQCVMYLDENPPDLEARLVSPQSSLIRPFQPECDLKFLQSNLMEELGQASADGKAVQYVDSEEPATLRSILKQGEFTIQKSLPCADYYMCVRNGEEMRLVYAVERKALSDLNAALNQRHENQLFRLLHLPIPRHHVIYLIEYQDESEIKHFKGIDVLLREINEIHATHGITVYWSPSKNFTILYLLQLFRNVIRMSDTFAKGFHIVENEQIYLRAFPPVQELFEFAKKGVSKRGNDSPELLFLGQLRLIRGMGEKKAKIIQTHYSSWSKLEELRKARGDDGAINELTKFVGPSRARKVIHALVATTPAPAPTRTPKKRKR